MSERDLLSGIRVIDTTLAAVGPFCTRVLTDLGADVLHVEWPRSRWSAATTGREPSRFQRDDTSVLDMESMLFLHNNGGKKSVAVNLKTEQGRQIVRRLIKSADVLVENMTPRVMRQFNLTYDELSEINPRLVMASMSGFGQGGYDGDENRPCTDPVAQAMRSPG
jgi:crotonobetainyl-CoA:carnitine CoA-transferase CaiB-like acyl-CoA transferase